MLACKLKMMLSRLDCNDVKVVCGGDSGIALGYLVLTKVILYCCILSQFVRRTQNLDKTAVSMIVLFKQFQLPL